MATEYEQKQFSPGVGQSKIFTTNAQFIFALAGKRGGKCVSADTLVSGQRMDSFGFEKGTAQLWNLGGLLRATEAHRVLTPKGWQHVSEGISGEQGQIDVFVSCPPLSTGELSLSEFLRGDLSSWQTIQGFQSDYLAYFHSNGGQPQTLEATYRDGSPLPVGVHAAAFAHKHELEHIRPYQASYRLSTKDAIYPSSQFSSVQDPDVEPDDERYLLNILAFPLSQLPSGLKAKVLSSFQEEELSSPYVYVITDDDASIYTIAVTRNLTITKDKVEPYWDTQLPGTHLYEVNGLINHNTTTGCYWSMQEAAKMRRRVLTTGEVTMMPPKGLIAAPTFDQLMQSTLSKFFEEFPHMRRYFKEYKKQFEVPIGKDSKGKTIYSVIYVRSLDIPKNIEGMNLDWGWVDEADSLTKLAWTTIRGRVSTTGGKLLFTTTIYPASWIYDEIYLRKNPKAEIITWPSIENPAFPQDEWDSLRQELDPIQFAREYEGKFMFDHGKVFADWGAWSVVDSLPEGVTPLATFFGLDFGSDDPTAILVMQFCSDNCWYIVDEFYKSGMNVDEINFELERFRETYGAPWSTIFDYAGGVAANSITTNVYPRECIKGPGSIEKGVNLMRNLVFQRRIFVFRKCHATLKERDTYIWDPNKPGIPKDKNNHAMDTGRYILFTAAHEVEGISAPEEKKVLPTLWAAMEEDGLLKDGVLGSRMERDDDYIF